MRLKWCLLIGLLIALPKVSYQKRQTDNTTPKNDGKKVVLKSDDKNVLENNVNEILSENLQEDFVAQPQIDRNSRILRISLPDLLPIKECSKILTDLQDAMNSLSKIVYQSLEGVVTVDEILVDIPPSWQPHNCPGFSFNNFPLNQDVDIHVSYNPDTASSHTVQPEGCGQPGDKMYLSWPHLPSNLTLANLWFKLRYGVFEDFLVESSNPEIFQTQTRIEPTSRQFAQCMGRTAKEVVNMHPDFQNPVATLVNYTQPRFRVTRRTIPRLVLAIENSIEMDARGQWEYIRTAAKKFILHDLPENIELGLVLFNTDAYIAHPVTKLGASMVSPIRNSLAFSINNRHNLSPKSELSCVRCAVDTALEALLMNNGNAGTSSEGGVVIVITRDDLASQQFEASTEASLESDLLKTAMKHNLRVYPIVLPQSDFSKGYPALERVAAQTRGSSFLLSDRLAAVAGGLTAQVDGKVGYGSVYMDLVEALRVVQTQTIQYSPQLLHEATFSPRESSTMEKGAFIIDQYTAHDTQFSVFFPQSTESFIKAVSVRDSNSPSVNTYSTVMDTTQSMHYYSLFSVPFDSEATIGQQWNYRLERLANRELRNKHVIQVTSSAQPGQSEVSINLMTNKDGFDIQVRPDEPLILYAKIMLGCGTPVIGAEVEALIRGTNKAGFPMPEIKIHLLDSGTGDPDMFQKDGIYSRYINNILEEGRYNVELRVTANNTLDNNVYFSRIQRGFAFRVMSLKRGSKDNFPPSRILDLTARRLEDSGEIKFAWTAPGDDYDTGLPTSYQIHSSADPSTFYRPTGNSLQLVDRFEGSVPAGVGQTHNINLTLFDKSLYFTILAVDDEGNVGYYSNIVKIYFPPKLDTQQFGGDSGRGAGDASSPTRQGLYDPLRGIWEPNSIIWYAVIGVVTVVIFTLVLVSISIIVSRRKRSSQSVTDEDEITHDDAAGGFKNNELLRFSSINLNMDAVQRSSSLDNPASQYRSPNPRINPYTELVIDTEYSNSSQDRLFYSSENLYNQLRSSTSKQHNSSAMAARSTDNMLLHSGSPSAAATADHSTAHLSYQHDSSMFTATAIYAKPLPKCERKSILKKPRELGDGESDPSASSASSDHNPSSELSELSESPISYLETDLDLGCATISHHQQLATINTMSIKRGPPTLPKPVLSSDNLNQFSPDASVTGGSSSLCSPNGSESCRDPNYGTLTPSTKRIRNVTQV